MSEQSAQSNVVQFPGDRDGSRFEDGDQLDMHNQYMTVPNYDTEAIAKVYELDAARRAREVANVSEAEKERTAILESGADLTRLQAVRQAAIDGQFRIVA